MNKKTLSVLFCLLLTAVPSLASDGIGLWNSIGLKKKLAKGLKIEAEAEYRLLCGWHQTDRWTVGTSLSYRLYRNPAANLDVKADFGYKFMRTYQESVITLKKVSNGFQEYNEDEEFFRSKHRAYASVSTGYKKGRFSFSLRERFQFTYSDSITIAETKYRYSSALGGLVAQQEEDGKPAKKKNLLRSRIGIDYDIPSCKINPYVSIELFNSLDDSFLLEKTRYILGGSYTLNKVHTLKLYYLYQDNGTDDEVGGSALGLSYGFEF